MPSGEFYVYGETSNSVFDSQGLILGDYIYKDVESACVYSEDRKAYSYENPNCQDFYLSPYWVARLTPNSSTADETTLLKEYFHRNHAYRVGNLSFQNKILVYEPILSELADAEKELVDTKQKLDFMGSYADGRSTIVDFKDSNSDSEYLNLIDSSPGYEFILFNGHGLPNFHQKNIVPVDVTKTNFFLTEVRSCSVGRFTTTDYIAGNYLFNGGLIVLAASTPVFASGQPNMPLDFGLTHGLTFYEALELGHGSGAANILGDPTLKMRYDYNNDRQSDSPVFDITDENGNAITAVHFSDKNPIAKIRITNNGSSTLEFAEFPQYDKQAYENPNSLNGFTFNKPFRCNSDNDCSFYLLDAGQGGIVESDSTYYLQFSSLQKKSGISPFGYDVMNADRTYSGKMFFISNDPAKPYVEIPFDIKKI